MVGCAELVRFADDFLMFFSCERDAHRVLRVLEKRFRKFGLEVHPEKTRLVRMIPPRTDVTTQKPKWCVKL